MRQERQANKLVKDLLISEISAMIDGFDGLALERAQKFWPDLTKLDMAALCNAFNLCERTRCKRIDERTNHD